MRIAAPIKVLLIEDSTADAQMVQALIATARDEFACQWVTSLAQGFNHLSSDEVDVILLDFGLPDSHGLDSFLEIQSKAPHTAIVPLTGSGDDEMALKAVQLGAQDYLYKASISGQVLLRSLRYAVERQRSQVALQRAHAELEQRVRERTSELENLYEAEREARRQAVELRVASVALSHRLVQVQEAERREIARELHDEVGQVLTGLKLLLETAARQPAADGVRDLSTAQNLLNDLMARVRNISLNLRPPMLDDLGLVHALVWLFDRYTAQTGILVTFNQTGLEGRRFAPEIETAAYRIVQEALTNVARHAQTNDVRIHLWIAEGVLSVQVEDHGSGFDPGAVAKHQQSSGLAGMTERAELLGGRVTIDSRPGFGTIVSADLPMKM